MDKMRIVVNPISTSTTTDLQTGRPISARPVHTAQVKELDKWLRRGLRQIRWKEWKR
jgi:hypothetical protein